MTNETEHEPDAVKILQMIETVDPADTAKMDEIDARTQCWLEGHEFVQMCSLIGGQEFTTGDSDQVGYEYPGARVFMKGTHKDGRKWNNSIGFRTYTRSRDALKAIRPARVGLMIRQSHDGTWDCFIHWPSSLNNGNKNIHGLPTEELAELYAIIQAIAHERNKK